MSNRSDEDMGRLLGLLAHDLRNPTATLGANISFVGEAGLDDEDASDAMQDMRHAIADLEGSLEQIACVGRWLAGGAAVQRADGDVVAACKAAVTSIQGLDVQLDAPDHPLHAEGGSNARYVLDLLLRNARQHARRGSVHVATEKRGGEVLVETHDEGPALASDLTERAFTLEGQTELKSRADGRYGRAAGLLAARAVTDTIGATLQADGQDGAARFRVRLRAK